MGTFDGKTPPRVVIVTGGSRGIGRSVVERLAADGFAVLFTHSGSDAEAGALESGLLGSGRLVRGIRLDVTGDDAPARVFEAAEELGTVTGLVNNAGVTGRIGPVVDLTDADLRRVVEVNLVGPVRLCREAARRWTGPAGGRSIVNVSSVAARTGSPYEYVAYAAAKAAVETLTVGLAKELAAGGVRVNAVSPGTVDTTIHARAGEPGRAGRVASRIPLGRPGRPQEIADAVSWLMSDGASYVTGAVVEVSGGL
ncbi:SDR family NAD(P)-dependent oxidoreductase [Streptomyces sp. NPDC051018]|uniref:SDR family NAD(P)-dependent oxidoreductase n=1 Tax=Streptomyces sp. NPDC051018 TaxID=3365639 RepID=UPI0037B3D7B7